MREILFWVLTVEIVGFAALPLLRAFFGNRRDSALLSRPVGLALTAYLGWLLALLASPGFTRGILLWALAGVAGISLLARRSGAGARPKEPFWGREEKLAAILFWAPTAVFLAIRAAVPEILGAEKFMDLAFFNSLTRHPAMPPADPWMAGKSINYYYWGYLLAAVPAKLSGVTPFVAYNLAVATFAGYSFVTAACLALRLSGGRFAAGLGAATATVFAGNFVGALDAWNAPLAKNFDYWHASRVIGSGKTINEFPFFTFFHADLHPHLLAFPFFLAAFVLAHRFAEREVSVTEGEPRSKFFLRHIPPILLLAVISGTALAANLWNTPAIALLLLFVGILRSTRGQRLPRRREALLGGLLGVVMILGSHLLFRLYFVSYQLPYRGIGETTATSGMVEFLGVWGIPFAVGMVALWSPRADSEEGERRSDFLLSLAAGAALLLALLYKTPALAPALLLAYLAARAARSALKNREGDWQTLFSSFLLLLSLAMIIGCEVIHFKDNYGAELHRMNTIFKFYHQAWPLLAVATAVFVERTWRQRGRNQTGYQLLLGAAFFLALLYPLNAAASRFRQREGPFSLDARNALEKRNSSDAAAIEWLEKNAPPDAVVMEATGPAYSEYARISSHTGIPTVLGWANHEGLWREHDPEVGERERLVKLFYSGPDLPAGLEILQRFRVTHVVVGNLEHELHPAATELEELPYLALAHPGETAIYRVLAAR